MLTLSKSILLGRSHAGYVLVFERSRTGWAVHAPDVLGCFATSRTLTGSRIMMEAALKMHLRAIRQDGVVVPRPRPLAELRRKRLVPVALTSNVRTA
jgi:predicted RNase H-like HicB family nuclease